MSTRELVFEYTSKGARAAAQADKRVRESVSRTGRTAERNSGKVERWLERSKKAVQMVAAATVAAAGAILAASPTMRAELSGIRAAIMLVADTIVRDLLPGTGTLSSKAIELAAAFRDLDQPLRSVVSTAGALGAVMSGVALIFGGIPALFVGGILAILAVWVKFLDEVDALDNAIAVATNTIRGIVRLLRGDFEGAIESGQAVIRNWNQMWRNIFSALLGFMGRWVTTLAVVVIQGVTDLKDGALQRFGQLRTGAIDRVTQLRDQAVNRVENMRARVVSVIGSLRDQAAERINVFRVRVTNAVSDARDSAVGSATQLRDMVVGRLTNVRDRGRVLIGSFRDGVVSRVRTARDRVGSAVGGIRDGMESRLSAARDRAHEIFDSLRDGLESRVDTASTRVRNIFSGLRLWISNTLSGQIFDAASNVADMIQSGILSFTLNPLESAFGTILDVFGTIVDRVGDLADEIADFTNIDIDLPEIPDMPDIPNPGDGRNRDDLNRGDDRNRDREDGDGMVGLNTGGMVRRSGVALIHRGERVLPSAQVTDRGEADLAGGGETTIERVVINVMGRGDPQRTGRDIGREFEKALESRGA